MKYNIIIKSFVMTVSIFLSIVFVQAQPASERPIPKMSVWMNKVEQNRARVKQQMNAQGNTGMSPAVSRPASKSQPGLVPAALQPVQRMPAPKPIEPALNQKPASEQRLQIPAKPRLKVGNEPK